MTSKLPVTIIDYEMGNLRSIGNAMRQVGADVTFARTPAEVAGAGHLILPGVGAFGASINNLRSTGLDEAIAAHVARGNPFIGICLGFQVMFDAGTEFASDMEGGHHKGLGLFAGSVDRFETDLHVPHMGWNHLRFAQDHPLWTDLPDDTHVYFVHSYRPSSAEPSTVIGTSDYGEVFPCAVARDNVAGCQFHPEKSGPHGLQILRNFIERM